MTEAFDYMGNATCAADGMCQEKCPVKINTGSSSRPPREREMAGKNSQDDGQQQLGPRHGSSALNTVDIAPESWAPRCSREPLGPSTR